MADTEVRSPNFITGIMAASSTGVRTDGLVSVWANASTHRLLVDAGTITTSSATAGLTGAAVPASADYIGVNSGGNLVGLSYGQATMANSLPVVLASNQTSIPVAATLAAETTKVIGTINIAAAQTIATVTTVTTVSAVTAISNALPAGTNILGKFTTDQTTHGTTDLVAADITKVGGAAITLGSKTSANSYPVVIASDQAANALWGHGATGSAVPANAVYSGVQARSSEISAATNANLVGLIADLVGKLIVLPYANPENFITGTTAAITDTTTTSIIAAQGAGVRSYITQITVTNSHATVGTFVKITDGASTIMHEGYAAAAGGGFTASFPTPLKGTANTAVNAICVTTGANVIASISGYKGV